MSCGKANFTVSGQPKTPAKLPQTLLYGNWPLRWLDSIIVPTFIDLSELVHNRCVRTFVQILHHLSGYKNSRKRKIWSMFFYSHKEVLHPRESNCVPVKIMSSELRSGYGKWTLAVVRLHIWEDLSRILSFFFFPDIRELTVTLQSLPPLPCAYFESPPSFLPFTCRHCLCTLCCAELYYWSCFFFLSCTSSNAQTSSFHHVVSIAADCFVITTACGMISCNHIDLLVLY